MSSLPHVWPPSAAPTAGLLPWMTPAPSYLPTVAIQTVLDDLSQVCLGPSALPWPSHLVVIDDQHRPQGCLAVGLLWSRQQGQGGDAPAVYLQDCLPWLEPIVTLMVSTSPANLSRLIVHSSAPCWVVVDAEGRYLGVVNRTDLLVQGVLRPTVSPLVATSVQEQQWVMTISHALKTPLTSLLGLSTLLLDHRVGPLNDRQSRYAGLMRRAIRKLIRLVNQLVDWMRLEAGQLELEATPLDLKALTETLLPTFLTSWLPDTATPPPWMESFRCQLPSQVPSLWADRLRLQQSLYGVLGYLLHRGSTPQSLTLEPWGPWVGLTLRAPLETDERLASVQVSSPWTVPLGAEVDGLETLGLALARRLCQQQGGDLVGFCSPQDGYQITILLPLASGSGTALAQEEDSPNAENLVTALGGLSTQGSRDQAGPATLLLLVSADSEWLVCTQKQIAAESTRLVLATRWDEALDLAQRLTPDLVLLDAALLGEVPEDPRTVLAQVAPQAVSLVLDHPQAIAQALAQRLSDQPSTMDRFPDQGRVTTPHSTPQSSTIQGPTVPLTLLVLTYLGQSALSNLQVALPEVWQTTLQSQRCRLVQANDLAQARLLCRVWQPQAIVLVDGLGFTEADWDKVAQCPELIQLPWVSLAGMAGPVPPGLRIVDGAMDSPMPQTIANLLQNL